MWFTDERGNKVNTENNKPGISSSQLHDKGSDVVEGEHFKNDDERRCRSCGGKLSDSDKVETCYNCDMFGHNDIREVLNDKTGNEIKLKVESKGVWDVFELKLPYESQYVSLQIEPRGDQKFIIEELEKMLQDTEIRNHDDLYLFGKHFDDKVQFWHSEVMDVFRKHKGHGVNEVEISNETGLDMHVVEGIVEMVKRRGWIKYSSDGHGKYEYDMKRMAPQKTINITQEF